MGSLFLRLRAWWETADRTQRAVTIFGTLFLLILLGGTFTFASRPRMEMVYGGLSAADQGKVIAEIQKLGIPVEYDLRGNVLVPSNQIAEVRATLAKNGVAVASGTVPAADLSSIGMMNPKAVETARLNAAREAEIARTIEIISAVESARVLISQPERRGFADEDQPASASVTITERPGAALGSDQAKAIAGMVAKSVPGMTTKNVTIVNQEGMTLFDGSEDESSAGRSANKLEAQLSEAKRIRREIQPVLDRAFGPGNTLLTVRVEMDFDQARERTTKITPHESPISEESVRETMRAAGAAAGGGEAAGAAANQPPLGPADTGLAAGAAGGAANNQDYDGQQKSRQFPYDTTVIERDRAPGTITGLTLSVLVRRKEDAPAAAPGTETEQERVVREFLEGYLGPRAEDPEFAFGVTVRETEFDATASNEAKKAQDAAAGADRMQQMFSLLPVAALIVVAVIVLKAITKVAKSQNVMVTALPDGRVIPMSVTASAAGVPGSLPEAQAEAGALPEGAPAEQAKAKQKAITAGPIDIDDIPDKLNMPLEQIRKMAQERPQTVAMLLKSWMVEDRR